MPHHHIILVPGLGDREEFMDYVTKSWKREVTVHIHPVPWKDSKPFAPKLHMLTELIDHCAKHGGKVSLIGVSAGGSMAINAYAAKKAKIHKVINICGRLQSKNHEFPSLDVAAKGFPAFKESVETCEKNIKKFTGADRKKIMTFSGLWDGIVPLSTIPVWGATNVKIPFAFHLICIGATFLFYKKRIVSFVKSN